MNSRKRDNFRSLTYLVRNSFVQACVLFHFGDNFVWEFSTIKVTGYPVWIILVFCKSFWNYFRFAAHTRRINGHTGLGTKLPVLFISQKSLTPREKGTRYTYIIQMDFGKHPTGPLTARVSILTIRQKG